MKIFSSCRERCLRLIESLNPGLFVSPSSESSCADLMREGDFMDKTPLTDVEAPIEHVTERSSSGPPLFTTPVQSLILYSPTDQRQSDSLATHLRRRNALCYDEMPRELANILQRHSAKNEC